MDLERIAALIWRFVGVITVGMAVPGALMQSVVVFSSALGSPGPMPAGSTFVTLTSVILIILGVAMIQFSPRLGQVIARGL